MKTFILYDDQRPNADGTRVLLNGLKLERFKKNPVMLYMHYRAANQDAKPDGSEVIGRWENIRIQGHQLLAEAVFDEEDPMAKRIARKVRDQFLKGASIGIEVHRNSEDKKDKLPEQKSSSIVESTLLEASIVDIPQNEDALEYANQNHCAFYQHFSYSTEQKPQPTNDELACGLHKLLNYETQQTPAGLLDHLRQTLTAYGQLRDWKKTFIQQQTQYLLKNALSEGLIQDHELPSYETQFAKDFDTATASLEALRTQLQKQTTERATLTHFLGSIQTSAPQTTTEATSTDPSETSTYLKLLRNEPTKLKQLQQEEPVAYRQLLEAHLTWKCTQLKTAQHTRRQHAQAYTV